jgi:tripartite-type tricarboxylate transporter receptor subunit TctC
MRRVLLALAASALFSVPGLSAVSAQDFYKGKSVKLIVGAAAGGGYDSHSRLVSKHMTHHIPGNPNIVVMNMPAAGGIVATNHVYAIADKDGASIGLFNRYSILAAILGNEQARFKVEEFNWLGTPASYSDNAYLFVIRAALPQKTVEDLRKADPPLSVGNVGSAPVRVLKEALGLNLKIIEGYKGSSELDLAFERGEVDGHTVGWANMLSRQPEWIEKGFVRPMIQFGRIDRLPALKDVPTAREVARTPEDRALIEFTETPLLMAFPFAAPPGVPADRVAILRKAFKDTMDDKAYQDDVAKQKLEFTPKFGEEVQEIIASMARAPKSVTDRYNEIVGSRQGG